MIKDKLSWHKRKAVRELIRAAGAKLFSPKFSPDLSPVEQVLAEPKHLITKAAARTIDAVCAAIGDALQDFTPIEFSKYLRNLGY